MAIGRSNEPKRPASSCGWICSVDKRTSGRQDLLLHLFNRWITSILGDVSVPRDRWRFWASATVWILWLVCICSFVCTPGVLTLNLIPPFVLYTHNIRIEANKRVGTSRPLSVVSQNLYRCVIRTQKIYASEKEEPVLAEEKTERDASMTAFNSPLVIMHVGDA